MIVVIGIGQRLRGDDEAGLAAVRLWQDAYPACAGGQHIRVELAESPGIGLLNLLENAKDAILVDAVLSGGQPGTLHKLTEADLAAFVAGSDSAHGWGVAETLLLGRNLDLQALPETITIIAIEAGQVNLGETLSPAVAAVLGDAARLIQATLKTLIS
ncbi:MAG: hydrogenase maturation protease [Anaerolineales bacterium]|nr:hydrogenase maturation protease [Anaerolineales bacterium]